VGAAPVTDAGWDANVLSAAEEVVIVALCSSAGRPCHDVLPIVDELASDLAGDARVLSINVDENPSAAQRYEVSSLPTLLVFRRGRLIGRLVGGRAKDRLLAELSPFLG
jgi:thioredoxin 1